ncbi:hypothetical protein [Phytomonospora endophytica]|uniref:Uncharacterized protein n=1 Tax=Phytomonospora endophytica TaxID=714109 RepID=A0A841FI65_9ACTN|nr:hypothetical protein [Phytomonospora endophytica]MBB6035445.1 hypothetical protein [Phytomonospora endophytica]GIG63802.1 hypothetical protein Pen01_00970 [Phytomonospora endophytica]
MTAGEPVHGVRRWVRALLSLAVFCVAFAVLVIVNHETDPPPGPKVDEATGLSYFEDFALAARSVETWPGGCYLAFGEGGTVWSADGDCSDPRPLWTAKAEGERPLVFVDSAAGAPGFYAGLAIEDGAGLEGRNRGYVAVGGFGGGDRTWELTRLPARNEWGNDVEPRAIVWDGTAFVVVGREGGEPAVWSSRNGHDWVLTRVPVTGEAAPLLLTTDGEGLVIASVRLGIPSSGYDDTLWWTRDSGATWKRATATEGRHGIDALVPDGAGFTAYGADADGTAATLVSVDGTEWTAATGPGCAWDGVATGPGPAGTLVLLGAPCDRLLLPGGTELAVPATAALPVGLADGRVALVDFRLGRLWLGTPG